MRLLVAPSLCSLLLAVGCVDAPWESPSSRLARVERKVDALMEVQLAQVPATSDACDRSDRRSRRTHRERRTVRLDRGPLASLSVDELAHMGRALQHVDPEGEPDGYRLSAIRADSVAARMGLRNGDVVHRVNGVALTSADQARLAWEQAASERVLHIDATRGDGEVELTVVFDAR